MRLFKENILECGGLTPLSISNTQVGADDHRCLELKAVSSHRTPKYRIAGFTVIELIVVISIIAALMVVSIPALKGISQSHTVSSASQQLMDDLALARQYAINNRSVVHVLFVSPAVGSLPLPNVANDLAKRLKGGAYSTYAIHAERTVGDQPGQPHPRYLSKWKSLPDGVFIAPREFEELTFKDWDAQNNPIGRPLLYNTGYPTYHPGFPFPKLGNTRIKLPHIAFGPHGGLLIEDDRGERQAPRDEVIELARGSIMVARNNTGDVISFDARESPPNNSVVNYNRIRIDGLTGRCTLERPEIP